MTRFPVSITLNRDSPGFICSTLAINDDDIPELEEDLQVELRLVDRGLASRVEIPRSDLTIRLKDNDATTSDSLH